jgi:hypothetical protein
LPKGIELSAMSDGYIKNVGLVGSVSLLITSITCPGSLS